jgi:phage shock protein C
MCADAGGGRLGGMEPMNDTTVRTSLDKEPTPAPPPEPTPADTAGAAGFGPADLTGQPHPAAVPARGSGGFRLHRSRTDRMLGGVCGGLAESLGVDAALLRIGLIALTLLGAGLGVVLYIAAWILVPEGDAD